MKYGSLQQHHRWHHYVVADDGAKMPLNPVFDLGKRRQRLLAVAVKNIEGDLNDIECSGVDGCKSSLLAVNRCSDGGHQAFLSQGLERLQQTHILEIFRCCRMQAQDIDAITL